MNNKDSMYNKDLKNKINNMISELNEMKQKLNKDDSNGKEECYESQEVQAINMAMGIIKKYLECM